MPTSGKDEEFLEVLSQLSYDIENNLVENCSLLIGLDSNQSEKSSRRRTDGMKQFNEQFSFKTVLQNDEPTFHHNNQTSSSQIDHILYYVPEQSKVKVMLYRHLCQLDNSENLSSHDAIIGTISLPSSCKPSNEPDYSSTYTPFVRSKPVWSENGMIGYQTESADILKKLANQFNQPEFIPLLSELFSKMLVICAENNFETIKPKMKTSKLKKPYFSPDHRAAYMSHESVCKEWRRQGRPKDINHPARIAKLSSQRNLQRIVRHEQSMKARKNHDDLMATFQQNISQVCNKLKKIRGENVRNSDITFIETLNGPFSGNNVLEGFCSNTETLCNENDEDLNHGFYKMCVQDNLIIFDIACQEEIRIPHMTLQNLKDILFKKLKLNKHVMCICSQLNICEMLETKHCLLSCSCLIR